MLYSIFECKSSFVDMERWNKHDTPQKVFNLVLNVRNYYSISYKFLPTCTLQFTCYEQLVNVRGIQNWGRHDYIIRMKCRGIREYMYPFMYTSICITSLIPIKFQKVWSRLKNFTCASQHALNTGIMTIALRHLSEQAKNDIYLWQGFFFACLGTWPMALELGVLLKIGNFHQSTSCI